MWKEEVNRGDDGKVIDIWRMKSQVDITHNNWIVSMVGDPDVVRMGPVAGSSFISRKTLSQGNVHIIEFKEVE